MSENRTKKPNFDPYALLEKRIDGLSEKLLEIEERTKRSFENLQEYIVQLAEITYADVSLLDHINHFPREGKTADFDSFVKTMHERDSAMQKIKKLGIRLPEGLDAAPDITDSILSYAHFWKIPFEAIASYIIEKFGKKEAKRLVKKETLLAHYGKVAIPIWEKVLEE